MNRPFEALLFDLGNTLYYFEGAWTEIYSQANGELMHSLKQAGLMLDEARFLAEFRERLDSYYSERESEFIEHTTAYVLGALLAEHGYPQIEPSVVRSALRSMYSVSQAHWQVEQEALPILSNLHAQGYRLGLVSNAADDEDVQVLVDKGGLRPVVEVIVSSAAVGIRKPSPKIFEQALNSLGVPASRAAMIGDSLGADILGAKNAGMFSIWITRRAEAPANQAHAETIHPDATIQSLSELPSLLESLSI
ncbi:MAG TPA: HAD family hydrolase [Anaerolineales bacterium]|nr:HAD family hydrolase [Anaerolineales bacterium]